MKKNKLSGKKILITGITGFVGSHLSERLEQMGADVYGISRSKKNKKILKASIYDFSLIEDYIKKNKITICFHLAGESLVEMGNKDPYHTFKSNVEGTLNILESSRKNFLERIIIASTSHVYGNNKVPAFEEYVPRPSRPYETSKTCTDLMAQSYADAFNLPVIIPRFVNIYGPGDLNFNRVIPKTIKAVLHDMPPTMWGGDAVRDYLYIDDAVNAYINLVEFDIEKITKNRIFNFGTGRIVSVESLIKKIINLSGKKLNINKIKEERMLEIKKQYLSWNKAGKILGWKPDTDLDTGIKRTINWYEEYFKI